MSMCPTQPSDDDEYASSSSSFLSSTASSSSSSSYTNSTATTSSGYTHNLNPTKTSTPVAQDLFDASRVVQILNSMKRDLMLLGYKEAYSISSESNRRCFRSGVEHNTAAGHWQLLIKIAGAMQVQQSDCTDRAKRRAKRKAQLLLKLLRDSWPEDSIGNSDDFPCTEVVIRFCCS
uniref:Uncharacterized protein n=1 Tax=Quercus lobata TaxID=97700 RepID=A0A7N2LF08_QUELO